MYHKWQLRLKCEHLTSTVHVSSYLRKSDDFHGNCRGFPCKLVQKFVDCLWWARGIVFRESAELSFRNPRNCLSDARGIFFGGPQNDLSESADYRVSKIVFRSPWNGLWESAHYQVHEIVLWEFCNIPTVHRGLRTPCINRCAISLERSAATLLWNIQVRT